MTGTGCGWSLQDTCYECCDDPWVGGYGKTSTGTPIHVGPFEVGVGRICGNYCGPGWCGGQYKNEGPDCDFDAAPEGWNQPNGPVCADQCCKAHDQCCGLTPDTSGCNAAIVACLEKCSMISGYSGDMCHNADGIAVPSTGILTAMSFKEDACCGSPCPASVPS